MTVMTTLILDRGVSPDTFASIKDYMKSFGSGGAMFVRFDGRYHIHVHDPVDLEKMRGQFGDLIEFEKATV